MDKHRGGFTTAAEAQAWVGQELIVTATLFRALGDRIENPTYTVWYYPFQPEGNVPSRSERWSSFYILDRKETVGDEIIKVSKPGSSSPWEYLEIIGTNELWMGYDNWYYKARKTTRPVLSAGHDDYCQVMGPCSAGQGGCDPENLSGCQDGLRCVNDVGATYGFVAEIGVCEAVSSIELRGAVDSRESSPGAWFSRAQEIARFNGGPLALSGWAYNAQAASVAVTVEIRVGWSARMSALAASVTADQTRADVNSAQGITGNHGFSWEVPAQYQNAAHKFWVYAVEPYAEADGPHSAHVPAQPRILTCAGRRFLLLVSWAMQCRARRLR